MTEGGRVDEAVAAARAVVGLYGDPGTSWFIGLELVLDEALGFAAVTARAAQLPALQPLLGRPPEVIAVGDDSWEPTVSELLDRPLGDRDPLVRVAVPDDTRRLFVAAHHGVVDGFGLLALAGQLTGRSITSAGHGIGARPAQRGFLRTSVGRLAEALIAPPSRLARGGGPGETSAAREPSQLIATVSVDAVRVEAVRIDTVRIDTVRIDTAAAVRATATSVADWNRGRGRPARRLVAAVATSRRDGSQPAIDRDTAYLRLSVGGGEEVDEQELRRLIAASSPEPDFPVRPMRPWASGVARLLRRRVGATFLVSNLGLVQGEGVRSAAVYPNAAGIRSLGVGVASTQHITTVVVRLPAADFTAQDAAAMCYAITARLTGLD